MGRSVILGFRPEDFEIASGDSSAARFRGLVERAEPRGTTTDLYVQTGTHELICRSRRWGDQGRGGHRADFEIHPGKTHFFDPEKGGLIRLPP